MKLILTNSILFIAVCLLCSSTAHAAPLRLGIGNSFVTFTKVSKDGPVSGSVPVGLSLWASYFIGDKVSADGLFELNLAKDKTSGNYTTVFLGGNGVISYYLTGGALKKINFKTLSVESLPRFNSNIFIGIGGGSYNFNAFNTSTGKIVKRATNNTLRGSTMGFVFGSSASLGIKENIFFNVQGRLFKGLPDEITPEIVNVIFGSGIEVML
jgi:hypothetical protein